MFNDESFEKKGLMAESPKSSYCKSSRRIGWKEVANGKVPILEKCRNKATVTCDNFTQMPYGERTGCENAYCSSCLEDAKKDHVWIEIKDDDGNIIFEGCNGCQRDKGFVWDREKGGYVKRGSKKAENFASDYEEAYDEMLDEMGAAALSQYSVSRMLRETDPIAYEVGMNDYESSLLADHQYEGDDSPYENMFDDDEELTSEGRKMLKEMYDEMLDETGVESLLNNYDASRLLKETDPIAYRVGLSDYESSMEEDDRNVYRDMAMQRKGMMAETFEASERKCGACGETGHNARSCKSKIVPFSKGGFWLDKSFDGLEQLGLPFVDRSHVAMISKIIDDEILKEPNARVRIPKITWKEEPITMTWGELAKKCKNGMLVSIGESTYDCTTLLKSFAYLPKNTVLTLYTGNTWPLKATFEYGGEEWLLFLAPRLESKYAETFVADYEVIMTEIGHSMKKDGEIFVFGDVVFALPNDKRSRISSYGQGADKASARQALIDRATNDMKKEEFGAESSGLTRLPSDEPNFDPQKADRNKDGKISSWERTVGNKVAKGIREGRKKGIDTFAEPFEDIGISKTYARLGVIAAGITALAIGVKKIRK